MLLFTAAACSSDMADQNPVAGKTAAQKKLLISEAANTSNPYDHSGVSYLSLLDSYDNYIPKPGNSTALASVLEEIGADLGFLNGYVTEPVSSIEALQQLSSADLAAALTQSGLSSQAQNLLLGCINGLQYLKNQDAAYEEAYSYLVSYEAAVEQSVLSAAEKEILLSTLSIVRFDIYNSSARKKKDRDWDLSVATTYGAIKSTPNAVISAGIARIKE
jgi:hypothetical protein